MTLLSFDYGRKKIGVAISNGTLAEPLIVLKGETKQELLEKSLKVVDGEKPEKIIIGISERTIALESESFGRELETASGVKVQFVDETLSTYDANQLAIAAGMRRKKRHDLEDAFAAAVILQQYVDTHN